jgi:hypothetical protein
MVETFLGVKKQQGVVVKTLVKFSEKVDFTVFIIFCLFHILFVPGKHFESLRCIDI